MICGCTVGKKYTEPTLDLPEQYRSADVSTDTATLGKMPLHDFFMDPGLQEIIDSTITRNYDLQLGSHEY